MPIYLVREYNMGVSANDWQEIRATSEVDAAQIICGSKLRTEGRREELRADVRRMGDPSKAPSILYSFYSDPNAEQISVFAVGTSIAGRPPHRSERAQLRHSAPTLGI
jgi:hypothetical protein